MTLWTVDCSPPGPSVHGILQARILVWVFISSSKGSSQLRDQTHILSLHCIAILLHCRGILYPLSHLGRLLLLLSHFSHVGLCATPETAAYQAPPSLGFSRQEHWSGLPFPSPMHESEKWKWSHSVVSDSVRPHRRQPPRLLLPWDFPGKSTGVACHCLLWGRLQSPVIN